jgi:hypothetical protein
MIRGSMSYNTLNKCNKFDCLLNQNGYCTHAKKKITDKVVMEWVKDSEPECPKLPRPFKK